MKHLNSMYKPLPLIILALLLIGIYSSFKKMDRPVEEYAMLIIEPRLMSNKVTISVDYGEKRGIFERDMIKDENGRIVKFNTAIDAMNWMSSQGWTFVSANAAGSANSSQYSQQMIFARQRQ
ncbi:hypothetical protein VB796_08845 [Arcicella sp. LKC2W]|uniref:hypothetical protein n=1 Tax=Arcicella sp. LKC2W TaxID=2984198 RepID=UPI002B1EE0C8|nr:hypothetical protein [Arcicella sp. LKC2W]MEA5459142.1 hypothetical protein [Arcicella sp. LKC2W]